MLVEDEQDILSIVTAHLKANGFVPNGFTDPVAALEEFKANPTKYSLVLTDIKMPGISGIELAQEVLRIEPSTKIALMTAFEIPANQLSLQLPVMTYENIILKPFKLSQICSRVKQLVYVK